MTSQTPQEKKCICTLPINRLGEVAHRFACPLYTPPAQENELFDCSGCSDPNSEGTHQGHSKQHGCIGCLHNEPTPQEKKCNCQLWEWDKSPEEKRHLTICPLYTPPAQEELFDCSGCSDPNSEGTHQGHSKQHGCVGCLHEEKKHVSDCCKSDYSAYGDTVNYVCNSCNKVCVVILLNPKNPDDYKAVEPPQPKEHLAQEEKVYFAPTPTAATESFLFDLFLKYEPKEPETWEDCTHLCHNEKNVVCLYCLSQDCDLIPIVSKICNYFVVAGVKIKKEDVDFVKRQLVTTRLSAAAEERKRVCEEMKKKIKKLEITEKKGFVEMVFGDKRKEKIRIHSNMDVGYNQAIEDILSLIESIKNSV